MFWRNNGKQIKFWIIALIPILALAALLYITIGTNQRVAIVDVDFKERVGIAPVQQILGEFGDEPNKRQLRVAVAGVLSPSKSLE